MTNYHSFHIVTISPWPLINSFNLINLLLNFILYFKFSYFSRTILIINKIIILISIFLWWRDISRERTYQGFHTINVIKGLKLGIILFITRELIFFISFFWSFFHFSLAPEIETGLNWPPTGIKIFNPYEIPLLNTIILLSSGVTITWAHYAIFKNCLINLIISLNLTILLGTTFTIFQIFEYLTRQFIINDRSFRSIFYIATCFHGTHVIIGTIFITTNITRWIKLEINNKHHLCFEIRAWYWHFVDVIWIYLYTILYWWFYFFYSLTKNMVLKKPK